MAGTDGQESQTDVALGSGKKETPQATTFTKEQVEKMVTDARTAVMADTKRFQVEAEKSLKAAQAASERLQKMDQERIDADLESHKDDPEGIKRIRAEQKAKQLEADLAKEREARTEYEGKVKTYETERAELTKNSVASEVSNRLNVDAQKLASLAKLTDGSQEAIEAIANAMPKITRTNLRPASNRSLGGMMTWEQIQADFINNPYAPGVRERYLEAKAQRR